MTAQTDSGTTAAPAETKTEEQVFEVYQSSKQSHRIVTPTGKTLHVINYQLITNNAADIEFLDNEIKAGFPYLRKGKAVSASERDPMVRLRNQMKEEAMAELLGNQATAKLADSSTALAATAAASATVKPASSAMLASTAAKSDSK